MRSKRVWEWVLTIAIGLAVIFVPSTDRLAAEDGGQWVRNGSQGYSLRRPIFAQVRRYDPDGILHVELADHQVLTVRVHHNPGNLSAHEWAEAWLAHGMDAGDGLVERAPLLPAVERSETSVGGLPAESLVLAGPAGLTRRTILTTASHVYLMDYPLGHETNEPLFDEMLASFESGAFAADSGVQVIEPDTLNSVPPLPVPFYSQLDPQWICDQLGNCTCDMDACTTESYTGIGDAGCFMTSQAMVFQYYTRNVLIDPQQYNNCLKSIGAYGSSSVCTLGLCGAPKNPPLPCRPELVKHTGVSTDLSVLDSDLVQGYPAVALIDGGHHYVVVTGKTAEGSYTINEPWPDPYFDRTQISPGEILHFVRYAGPVALGSVDGDRVVSSTDALIILSADAGLNTSQFCPMNCGDVNGDGLVNSTDALILLSYDVGVTVPFPVGEPGCSLSVTQPAGCTP